MAINLYRTVTVLAAHFLAHFSMNFTAETGSKTLHSAVVKTDGRNQIRRRSSS